MKMKNNYLLLATIVFLFTPALEARRMRYSEKIQAHEEFEREIHESRHEMFEREIAKERPDNQSQVPSIKELIAREKNRQTRHLRDFLNLLAKLEKDKKSEKFYYAFVTNARKTVGVLSMAQGVGLQASSSGEIYPINEYVILETAHSMQPKAETMTNWEESAGSEKAINSAGYSKLFSMYNETTAVDKPLKAYKS